jgi:hypothetical protein
MNLLLITIGVLLFVLGVGTMAACMLCAGNAYDPLYMKHQQTRWAWRATYALVAGIALLYGAGVLTSTLWR